jgi:hypothetical protein
MKKIYLLLLLGLFAASQAYSQYYVISRTYGPGNPGNLNTDPEYPIGGGAASGWTTILGGSQSTTAAGMSPATSIPFNFQFNGQPVTHFKAASIGLVTFDTTAQASTLSMTPAALPNSAIPNKSVVLWGLNGSGTNDYIITKMFGTAPNRQFWISYSSYAPIVNSATCWNYISVCLEETSNKIYIVDQRSNPGCSPTFYMGIQIDSTNAISVPGNPITANPSADATPSSNNYYEFGIGQLPSISMAMTSISSSLQTSVGTPLSVSGNVFNLGSSTVTSCMLNYSVNNGPVNSAQLNNLTIASNTAYNYVHSAAWTPTSKGNFNIKVWCSNINGSGIASDTIKRVISVVDTVVANVLVFEHFTNASCAPCAAYNPAFLALLNQNSEKATSIKFHTSWPGVDPMYSLNTADPDARVAFYGITGVPNVFLGSASGLNGISPANVTQAQINLYAAKSPIIEYDFTSQITSTTVTVNGTFLNPNNLKNGYRGYVAIIEDPVAYASAPGTNGETEFQCVVRKVFADNSGTQGQKLVNDSTTSVSYSYTIPSGVKAENLYVVVFAQDNTKLSCKGGKFKAGKGMRTVGTATSVNEIGVKAATVFPNPVRNNQATIQFEAQKSSDIVVTITSINGQMVKSFETTANAGMNNINVQTEGIAAGIYSVKVASSEAIFHAKMTIE